MTVRSTLTMISIVAILCMAFQYAPVASMSFFLLAPLPILLLGRSLQRQRFLKGRRAFLFTCLLTASVFYVGIYYGPLTAFLSSDTGWGNPQARLYVLKHWYKPLGKPIEVVKGYAPEWSTTALDKYSSTWQELGEEDERIYTSFGRTVFILSAAIGLYFGYLGWQDAERRQTIVDIDAIGGAVKVDDPLAPMVDSRLPSAPSRSDA